MGCTTSGRRDGLCSCRSALVAQDECGEEGAVQMEGNGMSPTYGLTSEERQSAHVDFRTSTSVTSYVPTGDTSGSSKLSKYLSGGGLPHEGKPMSTLINQRLSAFSSIFRSHDGEAEARPSTNATNQVETEALLSQAAVATTVETVEPQPSENGGDGKSVPDIDPSLAMSATSSKKTLQRSNSQGPQGQLRRSESQKFKRSGSQSSLNRMKRRPSQDLLGTLERKPSRSLQIMVENSKCINDVYDVDKRVIGKGSYGSVRKGKVKATGTARAIKCMLKQAQDSTQEARQKVEVDLLKEIDHPNIVKLYELFEDAQYIYIVMELCIGGSLEEHIGASVKITNSGASKTMLQLLRAVNYLHRNKICHRDLKPANCLMVAGKLVTSNLRVSDFGLSCKFQHGQVLKERVGTLKFMAPEVLDKAYTCACDVWSCGVILYNVLSGSVPFHGKDDDHVKDKIRAGRIEYPASHWAHVASDAMTLVDRMLVIDTKRCPIEEALDHEWIKKHNTDHNSAPLDAAVLSNLLAFRSLNKLKRSALCIIASVMDESVLRECRDAFIALDTDCDGQVSIKEIQQRMVRDDPEVNDDKMHGNVKPFSYTEFLAATLNRERCCKRDACQAAFNALDVDGDGVISKDELSNISNILGDLTEEELLELFEFFDRNGDGLLDFEEFVDIMRDTEGWSPITNATKRSWLSSPFNKPPRLSTESVKSPASPAASMSSSKWSMDHSVSTPKRASGKLSAPKMPFWKSKK